MQLTLELNPLQLVDIAKYLAGHTATVGSPTSNDLQSEDTLPASAPTSPTDADMAAQAIPVTVKAKAPKGSAPKPALPAFGRTAQQIEEYANSEEARIDTLDEKAELKQEKLDIAQREEDSALEELAAIKQTSHITPSAIKPPWDYKGL